MTAKEQFVSDLKSIQAMLAAERPNSDEWWKIKELRNQCQISWGQAYNIAEGNPEEHAKHYLYLTSPYREWIDSKVANIDEEVDELFNTK